MKHNLIAGFGAMLLSLTVIAALGASQDADVYAGWLKPGPPPLERFVKPLGLSSEQQKKLKPIFAAAQAKAAKEAEAAKAKPSSKEIASDALLTRETDLRVQLEAVLTAEQMAAYERLSAPYAANARTLIPHAAHGHSEILTSPSVTEASAVPAPPAN